MTNSKIRRLYHIIFVTLMIIGLSEVLDAIIRLVESGFLPQKSIVIGVVILTMTCTRIGIFWYAMLSLISDWGKISKGVNGNDNSNK